MHENLSKNLFTTDPTLFRSYQEDATKQIVFISYRNVRPDSEVARQCAEILERTGLHYWLDKDDECMRQAHATNNDLTKALCIERGLDVASALLGIIGPETFTSPWIPYEIGGFRGRQRFGNGSALPYGLPDDLPPDLPNAPHPMLAYFIEGVDLSKVPGFVALGYPLIYRYELENWAESVAQIRSLSPGSPRDVRSIQRDFGLHETYIRNTRDLKLSEL